MHNSHSMQVSLAGLSLKNPTILASGILGISAESLMRVASAGAGAVTTKSIGIEPREGYANPTVVEVECGFLNALGLPNPGIREFAEEIRKYRSDAPLIVSVYGFSPTEYAEVAAMAESSGANAIELNLSCPHIKGSGSEIGQDPEMIYDVVKNVKGAVEKPVFAKLSPNTSNIARLAEAAEDAGADAITAINTVKAMAIDIDTMKPILSNKIGGLSGVAIKPVAVRCVYEIYEAVRIPIIGCGGIRSWRDAVEFILAGASAVEIGSAIAHGDLTIFQSIAQGINSYIESKGYRKVEEIVGMAHES
ncbi:MAG: dihydroorotate dehydrogenase [Nitrososphaerota archaeon]|nr:dihydroorotate dehydrogenase [Candidatus Bathyarchaeota archaeon]MDW8048311.1 dihydroorotate dehydrogenase [Nitrososphaerota archaeon]